MKNGMKTHYLRVLYNDVFFLDVRHLQVKVYLKYVTIIAIYKMIFY